MLLHMSVRKSNMICQYCDKPDHSAKQCYKSTRPKPKPTPPSNFTTTNATSSQKWLVDLGLSYHILLISIIWPFILIGHITGLPITGMGLKTLSKPPNCHKLKVFGRLLSMVSSLHPPLFGGYLPTQSALHCLDILLNVFFREDRFPFQSHDSSIYRVFPSD